MDILNHVPSQGKLKTIFKRIVFGSHVHCPYCQSRTVRKVKTEKRWRCSSCDHPFSIKSSSWLKGSKLSLAQIWMLLVYWQKKTPVTLASDFMRLSYPTVFNWYAKFREHIPKEKLDTILSGDIACDEMYTRGNSIIGAKQKGTRNIALRVLHTKSVERHQAVDFLMRFTKANSNLFTDGAAIYRGIGNWHKLKHKYEIHKKWEFSLTAEIEGIWGVFRTFVRRMYHHVTTYKLQDLVEEFCLRFRRDEIFKSPSDYLRICLSPCPFAL